MNFQTSNETSLLLSGFAVHGQDKGCGGDFESSAEKLDDKKLRINNSGCNEKGEDPEERMERINSNHTQSID